MSTTIRLEHLVRQGFPDEAGTSFDVSRETYESLPVLPENKFSGDNWVIKEGNFKEVYRGSDKRRPAVWLYDSSEKFGEDSDPVDDQIYWILLWVEEEGIWVAFEYWNWATVGESYTATVEVSIPHHGDVYKLSEEAKNIVNKFYNFG